jgi:hypothetical protein
MYNIDDQVHIEENDVKNQKREYDCENSFSTHPDDDCTNWNFRVDGDGHIWDRNLSPKAVCFEY